MNKKGVQVTGGALAGIFFATGVCAQNLGANSDALSPASSGDWAAGFINFLFRGGELDGSIPFSGAHLASVAEALRNAMSVYSYAMLALAGLLLIYHIASMVAETAHSGVVGGKRANQVWAPIRLAVAVVLLVPIGSGLSVGQHIVLKIASTGSNLASHAWADIAGSMSGDFFGLVAPHEPDLAGFVTKSVEMEMCRNVYEQMRAAQTSDSFTHLAGGILGLDKFPATNMTPETWRYTNLLNASVPLCGEYRFTGYRAHSKTNPAYTDGTGQMADDIAVFSRSEAENTLAQARGIAVYMAPLFVTTEVATLPDIHTNLLALRQTVQQHIDDHLRTLNTTPNSLISTYLAQKDAGWITAAFFIPDLVRLQESYGEAISHILPDVQEPVFDHRLLTQQVLGDALLGEPTLRDSDHATTDGLFHFYTHVSNANARIHSWIYNGMTNSNEFMPGSAFDLRDQITAATEAPAAFSLFARAIDAAAVNHGVWGNAEATGETGNPFALSSLKQSYNPMAALVEFGRRQFDLGSDLVGLAGGIMSVPQILAPAILGSILGGLFILGGLGLVFVIPFLPFVRFLLAILTWLVELLEALIAIPLVALAHLTPYGQGLSGGAARQSYFLWISLAIRPILSVFGLVAGALIFALGMFVLLIAFAPLAQLASTTNSGILILANVGLVLTYDVLAYIVANAAFNGINRLPDQALRWISPFVMTEGATQDMSVAQTSPAPGTLLASSPVTAFLQSMSHAMGGDPREKAAASKSPNGQSPLFPNYRTEKDASADKLTPIDKANASHDGNTTAAAPVVQVSTTMTAKFDKEKDKKKDKKKDAVDESPFTSTIDKPDV